jgi:hypothetical protein
VLEIRPGTEAGKLTEGRSGRKYGPLALWGIHPIPSTALLAYVAPMSASNRHLFQLLAGAVKKPETLAHTITADDEGWQMAAWNHAKAGNHFCIYGYKAAHKTFVNELAHTYGYQLEMTKTKAVFIPKPDSASKPAATQDQPGAANNQATPGLDSPTQP